MLCFAVAVIFGTILQDKRSRFKFESKEKHELLGVIISMCLPVLKLSFYHTGFKSKLTISYVALSYFHAYLKSFL